MNKKYLITLLLVLLSFSFTACNKENENELIDNENEQIEDEYLEINTEYKDSKFNMNINNESAYIEDEDILKMYDYATSINYWFNICTINTDNENSITLKNPNYDYDMTYNLVPSFESYDEFYNFINAIFDKNLTDKFLESEMYINNDGKLYCADGARGTDITLGNDYYKITRRNEDIVLTIKTEVYSFDDEFNISGISDYVYNDFVLEYVEGAWKFTSFPVIR